MKEFPEYIEPRPNKENVNAVRVKIPYKNADGEKGFYMKTFSLKKYGNLTNAIKNAKKFRDEVKYKKAQGMIIKPKIYTLDNIFEMFMKAYSATIETKRKIRYQYGKYIQNIFGGNTKFSSIKFDRIQEELNNITTTASEDTIQRVCFIWKSMFDYAIKKEYITKNEFLKVKVPESEYIPEEREKEFEMSNLKKIIQKIPYSVKSDRESQLIQSALWIMLYTGLRPAEALGINASDIDFTDKEINLHTQIGTTSIEKNVPKYVLKSKNSYRTMPFGKELEKILKQLIKLKKDKDGYLFKKDDGTYMNGTYLSEIIRNISNKTFRPYMLRHRFVSDLVDNRTDPKTIQALMGHKNVDMTLYYGSSRKAKQRQAVLDRAKLIKI